MRWALLFLGILFLFPEILLAQIHDCDGVWTDKPCKSISQERNPLLSKEPPLTSDQIAKDAMRKLYHDLDMKRLSAKRAYGVDIPMSTALELCIGTLASLTKCREITTSLDDTLIDRIQNEKILREQKRSNDLLAKQAQGDTTNVQTNIIINKDSHDHWQRPRYPYGDDYLHPPRPKPTARPMPPSSFRPKNRFQAGDGF